MLYEVITYFYKKDEKVLGNIAGFAALIAAFTSVKEKKEYKTVFRQIESKIIPEIKKHEFDELNSYQIISKVFEDYKKQSPLVQEAQEMLRKWEAGDVV